jgi:hypothetical protein
MGEMIIPVLLSLFLGPGVGQLYNREYKKAVYLIILSAMVLVGAMIWFRQAMTPYLPADLTTIDRAALQAMVQNAVTHVINGRGSTFYTYEFILLILWVYSIVDAYRGALRRRGLKQR